MTWKPVATKLPWLEAARLAPSAHNTQPWLFVPLEDGRVIVCWERSRTLPASDPTARDLYLSLGAAIECARLGGAAAGITLSFVPGCEAIAQEQIAGYLVPCDTSIDPRDRLLARALPTRHTARTPHLARPLAPALLECLQLEASREGCVLRFVTERRPIYQLARLAQQATADQFAEPAVQAELWRWLRLDPQGLDYQRDGLNAECLNLRGATLTLARQTLPPTRMRRLARLRLHQLLALDTRWTVQRSTSLCLLSTPASDRVTLLRVGALLLRLWLLADLAGLSTHPISALLDCQATVAPTLAVFGASPETELPAALFRLGATVAVPRAPRLPLAELLLAEPQGGSV